MIFLLVSHETNSVERPTQSAIISFLVTGLSLLYISSKAPKILIPRRGTSNGCILPSQDRSHGTRSPSVSPRSASQLYAVFGRLLVLVPLAIALRVGFLEIALNSGCSKKTLHVSCNEALSGYSLMTWQGGILVLLAVNEIWTVPGQLSGSGPAFSIDGTGTLKRVFFGKARYVIPSLLLFGASLLEPSRIALQSTYICPISSVYPVLVPFLQDLGVVLDFLILSFTAILVERAPDATCASLVVGGILLVKTLYIIRDLRAANIMYRSRRLCFFLVAFCSVWFIFHT